MHGDGDLICFGCRLDQDRNTAAFGELDGVAGKVEPHLPQPRRIAKHARWQPLVDIAADFKALGLSPRAQEFDGVLDEARQSERLHREIEAAGLDFR